MAAMWPCLNFGSTNTRSVYSFYMSHDQHGSYCHFLQATLKIAPSLLCEANNYRLEYDILPTK